MRHFELTDKQYTVLLDTLQYRLDGLSQDMDALVAIRDREGFTPDLSRQLRHDITKLSDLQELMVGFGLPTKGANE